MKNALLILNVVLLVALGVLFYLHFSSKKDPSTKVGSSHTNGAVASKDCRIAYFEMDSIENSFAMVKEIRDELSKEDNRINKELTRMQKALNDKMIQYQSQAQTMSSIESAKANREFLQMRQSFAEQQQKI